MKKAHVFFKEDGKPYLIPELPVKPIQKDYEAGGNRPEIEPYVDPSYYDKLHVYEHLLEDAKANALPVVNPELLDEFDIFPVPGDSPYEWPGTWVTTALNAFNEPIAAKLIAPQQPQVDKTDNELIAEFMGCSKTSNPDFDYFWNGEFFKEYKAKWTTSWDWLMPVVEKIVSLNPREGKIHFWYQISHGHCAIWANGSFGIEWEYKTNADATIKAVYKGVVEFIKWYNAQPKHL